MFLFFVPSISPRFFNIDRLVMSVFGSTNLVLLDSIARIDSAAAGRVVVSGSHGGASAAKFVLDVGIHSLHRISKFTGKDGSVPKMNKLGTQTWTTLKNKTKKKDFS